MQEELTIKVPVRFQRLETDVIKAKSEITALQKKTNPTKYLTYDEITDLQMEMALDGYFDEVDGTDICRDNLGWYIMAETIWPDTVLAIRERLDVPSSFKVERRFIGELLGTYKGIRISLNKVEKWHSSLPSFKRDLSATVRSCEEVILLD